MKTKVNAWSAYLLGAACVVMSSGACAVTSASVASASAAKARTSVKLPVAVASKSATVSARVQARPNAVTSSAQAAKLKAVGAQQKVAGAVNPPPATATSRAATLNP